MLRHVADLLALNDTAAETGVAVRLTATVTVYNPGQYQCFVQEGDAGAYVVVFADSPWRLNPGDRVRIEGKSQRGGYAPVIYPNRIERIGWAGLPQPARPATWREVRDTDRFDNRYAEVRGRLLSVRPLMLSGNQHEPDSLRLEIDRNGERIEALLTVPDSRELSAMIQSEVAVRGVISPSRMQSKQRHDAWLVVSSASDIRELSRRKVEWNAWPRIPLPQLLAHGGSGAPAAYFRTEGTATSVDKGGTIILEEDIAAITAREAAPQTVRKGMRYEVFGRLRRGDRQSFYIDEAQFR